MTPTNEEARRLLEDISRRSALIEDDGPQRTFNFGGITGNVIIVQTIEQLTLNPPHNTGPASRG